MRKANVRGPRVSAVATEPHTSHQMHAHVLRLSPWLFRLCWIGLNVAQGVLVGVYVELVKLHKTLCRVQILFERREVISEDDVPYETMLLKLHEGSARYLKPVTISLALIAVIHGVELLLTLGCSLWHRELRFHTTSGATIHSHVCFLAGWIANALRASLCSLWIERLATVIFNIWQRVRGSYVFRAMSTSLLIEMVEVACQTAQAYRMSLYVSVPWINRLFALSTTVNCWSTPCIYALLHHKPVAQYVVTVVVDATLSAFQTVAIPWMIIYPYYQNAPRSSLPIKGTRYMSSMASQVDYNVRQLFPSSFTSFLAIVTPGFFMIIYFSAIKGTLIRNRGDIVPMATRKSSNLPDKPIASRSAKEYDQVLADVLSPPHKPSPPSSKQIPFQFVHILLFLWGVGVLGCFLFSMRVGTFAEDVGCVLSRRPWLSSAYWCYLVNVSCARNHVVGRRYELQAIFSHLVRNELQELIISDCGELEMPSQIQDFPNIHLVLIYNSTIAAWDLDAALTANAHPSLMSISVVETKLTAIPSALLHPDLPSVLTDIAFSGTNLTTIPDNVHEFWTSVFKLTLEASPGVTEFPPSISEMSWVNQLSLVGNSISTIEANSFTGSMFSTLDFSENPLLTLPVSLGANFGMGSLSIKMTDVSNIPFEWLELYAETSGWTVSAAGSPLCGRLIAGETDLQGDMSMTAEFLPLSDAWKIGNIQVSCDSELRNNRWFSG